MVRSRAGAGRETGKVSFPASFASESWSTGFIFSARRRIHQVLFWSFLGVANFSTSPVRPVARHVFPFPASMPGIPAPHLVVGPRAPVIIAPIVLIRMGRAVGTVARVGLGPVIPLRKTGKGRYGNGHGERWPIFVQEARDLPGRWRYEEIPGGEVMPGSITWYCRAKEQERHQNQTNRKGPSTHDLVSLRF